MINRDLPVPTTRCLSSKILSIPVAVSFLQAKESIRINPDGELRVQVMELHNSTTIRETGRRVRRGQQGRILANLTAGDYSYGYESFFVNPDAVNLDRRGPKPEKNVRIKESEACWIRRIFALFIACWSLNSIARELNRLGRRSAALPGGAVGTPTYPFHFRQSQIHWVLAIRQDDNNPQFEGSKAASRGSRTGLDDHRSAGPSHY